MLEAKAEVPDPEANRIVLLDQNNVAAEIQAVDDNGRQLLNAVRSTLEAAQNAHLLTAVRMGRINSAPAMITVERTLELVTAEYRAHPHNPQLLSEFNQVFWNSKRQAMGLSQADLVVPQAPYTEEQIRKFMGLAVPDFALYVPQVVSTTPEGLVFLGEVWPQIDSWAYQEDTTVRNADKAGHLIDLYGWMRTERTINAPYLRTNQQRAEKIIADKDRIGDTLNIYAIAGQQSKLSTDQYLDEVRTEIRVLSSRDQGRVLRADFHSDGYCDVVRFLEPGDVDGNLGTRSVEVAKT